ncbi:MAG: patatin-like phospholipase family protein [Gammaproteobacteria bacterium]|nr:patatin-like phospholipase family protein [Gammaproteobacteria bacterium]
MTKKRILIIIMMIVAFVMLSHWYNQNYSKALVLSPLPPENIKTCHPINPREQKDTIRVLVVDGGGIDGIMPLVLLNYLEEKTGRPTSDLFNFFTGTSTGSIIATTLNVPTPTGQVRYTAKQILMLYRTVSKKILNPHIIRSIFTLHGLIAPRLSIDVLHKGFTKLLGPNMTFGQLINPVAVTAYNINAQKLDIFNSWDCNKPISRYAVSDVIAAATATPSRFSPVKFTNYKAQGPGVFIDGMVYANNPSLYAIQEAFKLFPKAKKFIIVHLGTGGNSLDYLELSGSKVQRWGILNWVHPLSTMLYKSQNTIIKEAIRSIQKFSTQTKFSYYYYSKNLENAQPFNTSDRNIRTIEEVSEELITEKSKSLDKLAAELVRGIRG